MVNKAGEAHYVKFHLKTDQGIKNFDAKEADDMTRDDPDFSIRDLYNAIADENFPSWTMHVQVMSLQEAQSCPYNPFDLTKIWPHKDFPLRQVGKLVLNRNPKNYFAEVEQSAFSPANLVPGIEASPDKMLQGRMFSYSDTHRHRLGANFNQIPVNCPYRCVARNYQRDGPMTIDGNQAGAPNYFPNSFSGPNVDRSYVESSIQASSEGGRFDSSDEDNYGQLGLFIRDVLDGPARDRLVENMAAHLFNAQKFIRDRVIENFSVADEDFAKRLSQKVDQLAKK
jgi:catalase